MKTTTTPSHILLLLLQLWATVTAAATSNPPPAAPPLAVFHNSDPSFIPIFMTFGCILLIVGFFTIYLWYCSDTRFSAADPTQAFATCCSCGPHGLNPKLLDTFPLFTYSTIKNLKPRIIVPLQCTVCLMEYKYHDSLRLLPKCNHVFHRECIDKWLASHVTCPLCRAQLSSMSPAYRHRGDDREEVEMAIVISNDEVNNAQQEISDSSMSEMNVVGFGDTSLRRCHTTTGHSLGFMLPVRANYGRSASDSSEFYGRQGEESRRELLGHCSVAPAFVSHGNVPSSSSSFHHEHVTLNTT